MPWCETCDKFLSPSTVHADGTCPRCGRTVDPGRAHGARLTDAAEGTPVLAANARTADTDMGHGTDVEDDRNDGDDEDLPPIPWHLKLLACAVAVYLGYRAFQGIEWLVGRF